MICKERVERNSFGLGVYLLIAILYLFFGVPYLYADELDSARNFNDEIVKNHTFIGKYNKRISFQNGEYSKRDEDGYYGADIRLTAYGDFLPSAGQEAVVVYVYTGGGSGWFSVLTGLKRAGDRLVQLPMIELGDRLKFHSMKIQDGGVVVDMTVHGPGDGLCCPTYRVIREYILKDDAWVMQSEREK